MHRLILASASPQRKSLLAGFGLSFDVAPSDVAEESCGEVHPRRRAQALAELKARDIARKHPESWVIGCDTLVVGCEGTILEKPRDERDARRMLQLQSGKTSVVHSGLCLVAPDGREASDVSSSFVTFKTLSDQEIEWWIGTDQWRDRSGGFQIDGLGQLMIAKIEGDWTSIVGFPVFLFGEMCRGIGAAFLKVL
ncbi:septum formation protein Maf [Candidatus Peregrinibacteria bacterium]|nr:septum formation protein Maf [Candidatus Peregrinibacteria bacterium]